MTRNNCHANQSGLDSSQRPPAQHTMPASRDTTVSRREFIGITAGSILVGGMLDLAAEPDSKNGIPHRTLGRTGEKVSLIGLGGYHLGKQNDPDESIRIFRAGIDEGINFLDNYWDYNCGESEIRMGQSAARWLSPEGFSDDQDRRSN